jgi:hypothetical protein
MTLRNSELDPNDWDLSPVDKIFSILQALIFVMIIGLLTNIPVWIIEYLTAGR